MMAMGRFGMCWLWPWRSAVGSAALCVVCARGAAKSKFLSVGGKIKKVRRDLSGTFEGETYVVPSLDFYECPACGEKVFDREAMRKIEAHSPAFVLATH